MPVRLPVAMADYKQQFQQANALMQEGRLREAGDICEGLLKQQPALVPALNMYGVVQIRLGKFPAAIELFTKAIEADGNNPASYEQLGRAYMSTGQPDLARENFEQAISLNPQSFGALSGLGGVLMTQNNYEEALDVFRKAQSLFPNRPVLYLNLGTVLLRLGRIEEAVTQYTKVFEFDPDSNDANICLGKLHKDQKDFQAAVRHFSAAIQQGANNAEIEIELADSLDQIGEWEQARQHYFAAVDCEPDSQRTYIALDMALLRDAGAIHSDLLGKIARDYVYPDWNEALDDARVLAKHMRYPDARTLDTLNAFLDGYQPGKLHDADWWREQLASFGDPALGHDKVMRTVHSAVFCWSLPDRETLSRINEFIDGTRLFSFGSGSGVWERLLAEHFSVDVVATDFNLRHRFLPMTEVDYSKATVDAGDTIFVAWIIRNDIGILNVLKQLRTGQKLVLVGEPPDSQGTPRICASREVLRFLDEEFVLEDDLQLVTYSFMNDIVHLYIRK